MSSLPRQRLSGSFRRANFWSSCLPYPGYHTGVSCGFSQKPWRNPWSLFIYYINDLQDRLRSTFRLFADDTIAYLTITSEDDAEHLQEDLDKLAQSFKLNGRSLKTNLAALRCTLSSFLMSVWWWGSHTGLAYSTSGQTRVLYACSLIDIDEIFRFLHRKPTWNHD
jgi:hypothetical protein